MWGLEEPQLQVFVTSDSVWPNIYSTKFKPDSISGDVLLVQKIATANKLSLAGRAASLNETDSDVDEFIMLYMMIFVLSICTVSKATLSRQSYVILTLDQFNKLRMFGSCYHRGYCRCAVTGRSGRWSHNFRFSNFFFFSSDNRTRVASSFSSTVTPSEHS